MGRHAARHSCPFCNHGYTDLKSVDDNRMGMRGQRLEDDSRPQRYFVRCCSCDAMGPIADTKEEATAQWDARPQRTDCAGEPVGVPDQIDERLCKLAYDHVRIMAPNIYERVATLASIQPLELEARAKLERQVMAIARDALNV